MGLVAKGDRVMLFGSPKGFPIIGHIEGFMPIIEKIMVILEGEAIPLPFSKQDLAQLPTPKEATSR